MWKSFVLELHGEWSEVADECICLLTTVQRRAHVRLDDYSSACLAALLAQLLDDALPNPAVAPEAKMFMNRFPGREIAR
jgi:hypothetical protein